MAHLRQAATPTNTPAVDFGPHARQLLRGLKFLDLARPEVSAVVRERAKAIAAKRGAR